VLVKLGKRQTIADLSVEQIRYAIVHDNAIRCDGVTPAAVLDGHGSNTGFHSGGRSPQTSGRVAGRKRLKPKKRPAATPSDHLSIFTTDAEKGETYKHLGISKDYKTLEETASILGDLMSSLCPKSASRESRSLLTVASIGRFCRSLWD
jgi:hypothetical protein